MKISGKTVENFEKSCGNIEKIISKNSENIFENFKKKIIMFLRKNSLNFEKAVAKLQKKF